MTLCIFDPYFDTDSFGYCSWYESGDESDFGVDDDDYDDEDED